MAKNRQAVLVIHGIGEQRPMETLRGLVESILPDAQGEHQYWSKPDRISGSYELRRLKAPPIRQVRPGTDFYEYYWAHNMRDTKWRHLGSWFVRMLRTLPRSASPKIQLLWGATWLAIISSAAFAMSSAGAAFRGGLIAAIPSGSMVATAVSLAASALLGKALYSVGDAARYLEPTADNVAQREAIRQGGVERLRRIQEQGKYDRIVVIGHSLGSVIGYDIVRCAWEEYRQAFSTRLKQQALEEFSRLCNRMQQAKTDSEREALRDKYQDLQRQVWQEFRALGNEWLVTDLVTIGSPLAHARFLLADSSDDFDEMKRFGILPTCPPQLDSRGECSYSVTRNVDGLGPTTAKVLTSESPFACVRWTNIYYRGDLIGGPVAPAFGPGVRDREVRLRGGVVAWLLTISPFSHTRYWAPRRRSRSSAAYADSVTRLRSAMDLDNQRLLNFGGDNVND